MPGKRSKKKKSVKKGGAAVAAKKKVAPKPATPSFSVPQSKANVKLIRGFLEVKVMFPKVFAQKHFEVNVQGKFVEVATVKHASKFKLHLPYPHALTVQDESGDNSVSWNKKLGVLDIVLRIDAFGELASKREQVLNKPNVSVKSSGKEEKKKKPNKLKNNKRKQPDAAVEAPVEQDVRESDESALEPPAKKQKKQKNKKKKNFVEGGSAMLSIAESVNASQDAKVAKLVNKEKKFLAYSDAKEQKQQQRKEKRAHEKVEKAEALRKAVEEFEAKAPARDRHKQKKQKR
jgi:hypothetical protein